MLDILENGVSLWPKYDGRWPLTAGLKFKFDPSKEPGSRILRESFVKSDGSPIEMDKIYSLACKYFLQTGKDGFTTFLEPSIERMFTDYKECPTIQTCLRNFF
jgi:5'-nucleotidase